MAGSCPVVTAAVSRCGFCRRQHRFPTARDGRGSGGDGYGVGVAAEGSDLFPDGASSRGASAGVPGGADYSNDVTLVR
jgi:hypothetical protein